MPKFSESGNDIVMCQLCGREIDTGKEKVLWRPDLTGHESAGNVCESCLSRVIKVEFKRTKACVTCKKQVPIGELFIKGVLFYCDDCLNDCL